VSGARARARAVFGLGLALAACAPPPAPSESGAHLAVLAPAAAETLVLLGETDRVVAVGDWVVWPPEIASKPKLGAYDDPSRERLLELGVDTLVTSFSVAGRAGREELARLGIDVIEIETSTFEGALAGIAAVGERVGRAEAAERLVADVRARVAAVEAAVAGASRVRTLVVVGRDPLYVAGPGSHLDELVLLAGGENVAADAEAPYALVSLEAMLARRPEVIVDLSENRPGAPRGAVAGDWSRWPFLPAVESGRVHFVDPSRLAIPGPRLGEMAERMGRLLHPERFGAPRADDHAPLGSTAE